MNRNTPEDLVRELLQSNRNLTQDADDDSIRWITIHPFGMTQEEADTGEGKRYYQRIPVDKESGTIVGGLGGKLKGTKIEDLGEKLKELRENKGEKQTDTDSNLTDLQKKIKALTEGKEYTEEVANQVGDLMRQELEKNKDYIKAVSDMERVNNEIDRLVDECKNFDLAKSEWVTQKEQGNSVIQEFEKLKADYVNRLYSEKITNEQYKELISSYGYKKLKTKATEERFKINDEINAERKKITDQIVTAKINREKMSQNVISAVRESLKDAINFSDTSIDVGANTAQFRQNIDNGLKLYSKELLGVIDQSGVKAKFSVGRSAFLPRENIVEVNKSLGSIAHEFAHCIEHNNPQILKLEEEFYNRRTKDEKLKTMKSVTGDPGYKMDEMTRTDKFLNPYMGKDYGFALYYNMKKMNKRYGVFANVGEYSREEFKPDGYELLSMGVETLIEKPHLLKKDPDYANFVLGCLAYKG